MGVKVFVMGLPGSGKSTATGCISMVAQDEQCSVLCFNDYDILRKWFEAAPDGPDFSRIHGDGFDIHNYEVFDTSLRVLEQQVRLATKHSCEEIVTIEFARSDYLNALAQFSASFLQDAYFLFIDAEVETCKDRIQQRVSNQHSSDDHQVSDYIFEAYYHNGREYCTAADINALRDSDDTPYTIDYRKMRLVNNTKGNSLQDFYFDINQVTHGIIKHKAITVDQNTPTLTSLIGKQS